MNENTSTKNAVPGSHGDTTFLNVLNALSAIAVVFLHTNYCFWSFNRTYVWISANVIESVFFFAVPVFFMISGATLLDYRRRYSTAVFFKKRMYKTVLPFLIWSLFALAFDILVLHSVRISELSFAYIWNGIFGTKFLSIYWFFIPLFCLYASMPLFSGINEENRPEVLAYVATAGGIVNLAIPFVIKTFSLKVVFPISVQAIAGDLIFVPLGYLLSRCDISKKCAWMIYSLALAGLAMIMVGTHVRSMGTGSVDSFFKGHHNLPAVLYASGIFLFFRRNSEWLLRNRPLSGLIQVIRCHSFSIYLVHWYVLTLFVMALKKFSVFSNVEFSLIFRVMAPFVIVAISIAVSSLVRRIPVVGKHIFP